MNAAINASTPIKAYKYCRVSTQTQTEKYGLKMQDGAINEFATVNNIEIVDSFVDAGISGAMSSGFDSYEDEDIEEDITKREGFLDMLLAIDKYNIKYIIVFNKARLWRDDKVKMYIMHELRKRKVEIISVKEPSYSLYSKDPNDYLINNILDLLDVFDRMNINMKLAASRRSKAETDKTKPAGILPYGYKYSNDKKKVLINEEEASVIRTIFNMRAGGCGFQEIAEKLNKDNHVSIKGNAWSRQTVYSKIKNDFYIGVLTYEKKMKGTHEPIVSLDVWKNIHPDYEYSTIL